MCEEEVNVALGLWKFSQVLKNKSKREELGPPNKSKDGYDLVYKQTETSYVNSYNYCCVSVASLEVFALSGTI